MTSSITNYSSLINPAFPVAGQDNDSQGFRDNFTNIQNALSQASTELSDIQLTYAKLDTANDFDGNVITNATLVGNAYTAQEQNVVVGAGSIFTVDYDGGEYHILNLSTNTNFQFTNWPATTSNDRLGKMRLEVIPTTGTQYYYTMNFSSAVPGGSIHAQRSLPYTTTGTYFYPWRHIWDVWTHDAGQNTFVQFVGTWT